MARHGIYQKLERFLIKSFVYICEGLVLVHRHFLKPRNVGLVVEKNGKTLKVIGGNVEDSVTLKHLELDDNGILIDKSKKMVCYFKKQVKR
jgi:hypothetical protein